MLFGLVGAGKTTLARELESEGAVRLSLDEWTIAATGDRLYLDRSVEERIRERLSDLWPRIARAGVDVVLDFGFWERTQRDSVRKTAKLLGSQVGLIWVRCAEDERRRRCIERSTNRLDSYIIDRDGFAWIAANRTVEPLGDNEDHRVVDTTDATSAG